MVAVGKSPTTRLEHMTKRKLAFCDSGSTKAPGRTAFSLPHAIGAASLVAAGLFAWWLRASDSLPRVSPIRALCLMIVCAYLVTSTLLLLDER